MTYVKANGKLQALTLLVIMVKSKIVCLIKNNLMVYVYSCLRSHVQPHKTEYVYHYLLLKNTKSLVVIIKG